MSKGTDTQVFRFGAWSQRLLVLFLVAGVVYVNMSDKHQVRNWIALVVVGCGLALMRTFWIRHLWRQKGFNPDADEIAEAHEEAAELGRRSRE